MPRVWHAVVLIVLSVLVVTPNKTQAEPTTLLNVSYDATRELYKSYDQGFAQFWKHKTGQGVTVNQSHGGSGKQARAVIDGLDADVVTLALSYDIEAIQKAGLIKPGWENKFPFHSVPFTSAIVFVVRNGNPKHIKDWSDLVRPDVSIVVPDPKTSGGARWAYLAAYGYALKKNNGNAAAARDFVKRLYANVPELDSGARAATDTFVQRQQGDVLIAWESEALLTTRKLARGAAQIVYPSISIQCQTPVALVDENVDRHDTREAATLYLQGLYSPQGQQIGVDNYYRPQITKGINSEIEIFPKIQLFTIDKVFGGWDNAQKVHFADGGVFDQITAR